MKKNKIVWFLLGNPKKIASSRIHGFNIHKKLMDIGYNSHLAYIPKHIEEKIPLSAKSINRKAFPLNPGDIIVLQKIKNQINLDLFEVLKRKGIKIVFIDCDLPISHETANIADITICSSTYLCDLYRKNKVNPIFIEDCPEFYGEDLKVNTTNSKLKCYWFGDGSQEKWDEVLRLKAIFEKVSLCAPREKKWQLITISNHQDADIAWRNDDFLIQLKNADAIAIPVFNKTEASLAKSANRLLQSMAISKPVICSSIPSYSHVIKNKENAIMCNSEEEWVSALKILEDSSLRTIIGQNAHKTSLSYHIDSSINKWILSLGLSDEFLVDSRKYYSKEKRRIENYFYNQLLSRNISYWDNKLLTFTSLFIYIKGKARNFISKFR